MQFEKTSELKDAAQAVFDWHARRGAFQRLAPPWDKVRLIKGDGGLAVGKQAEIEMATPIGKRRWLAEHIACDEGKYFVDTQREGPFAKWRHEHRFEALGSDSCRLVDRIEYALPLPPFGDLVAGGMVGRKLERAFAYRHAITQADVAHRKMLKDFRPLKILVSGGTGFLGGGLVSFLRAQGHTVKILSRREGLPDGIRWDPVKEKIDRDALEGFDAMIHLAGQSLTSGRWNADRKRSMWQSRIDSTRLLVDAIKGLERPPKVLLSGSAIGYYGDRGDEKLDENASLGQGYLAELCAAWEAEAQRASPVVERVGCLRTGVVLDPRGGALKQMLPAFRFGLGGPLGSGEQWFPWIALEDWIHAVSFCLFSPSAVGGINLAAPGCVRQKEFAKVLGGVLRRPALLPAPAFAMRALFGEMADEALLASSRVTPSSLQESGYPFRFPEVKSALSFSLGI